MTAKYTTRKPRRTKAQWVDTMDEEVVCRSEPALQELEDTFTGLLDANGDEIYRCAPKIGFDLERFK